MLATFALLLQAVTCTAQFVDSNPKDLNLTVVRSPGDHNVTVSFKEPHGACRTTFDKQKQYTGWVNIPGDFETNMFFWFVEARQPTKDLTIWLNGGPGSSSMLGFFNGQGPCHVIEKGLNDFDTIASEWGWDRASNMLFIDQPNQVGFSYDEPTDGTVDLLNGSAIYMPPEQYNEAWPEWALLNGTFSSMDGQATTNTSQTAAMSVWHLMQGFLATFPQYQPPENEPVGVNLFAESYGGRYGPIFADVWEQQNEKRTSGKLSSKTTLDIKLTSLGIINGCIDREIQMVSDIDFANKNTYGYKAIDDDEAKLLRDRFHADGGCQQQLRQCVSLAQSQDADGEGDNRRVNKICSNAANTCQKIESRYYAAGRSVYDLASPFTDPFPPLTLLEYLNQDKFQQTIGARTNFTLSSESVFSVFYYTGDIARGQTVSRLADLVKKGVRVGLIYGDRDYICNWMGGEAVSLSVAEQIGGDYASKFPEAGYASVQVNNSYVGGAVRQFGNLSFSRIYQAGHAAAFYQPETVFQVFARIMTGKSLSTGKNVDLSKFDTKGSANATVTAELPNMPDPTCYVRGFLDTCNTGARLLARQGGGVVINGVLYNKSEDWSLHDKTGSSPSSPSATWTGVFTATETADSDSAASSFTHNGMWAVYCPIAMMVLPYLF